jgi:DNA-binding NtrC family response regulator
VRELKNAVERSAILADVTIDVQSLPVPQAEEPQSTDTALSVEIGTPMDAIERRVILATLESLGGNKRRAAEVLGISLKTLYNRLNVYQAQEQGRRAETSSH